jgi:DedD protein
MVQVGVFADTANVKQIQSKLETNGFKVQSNAYANGKVRVRVGPYSSKAEADTAIAKLQSLKFNPMIVND